MASSELRVLDVQASEPSSVPLATAMEALFASARQPTVVRVNLAPADAEGATVSLAVPTSRDLLTTLRVALTAVADAGGEGSTKTELSFDFKASPPRPDQLQLVVEAAVATLRTRRASPHSEVAGSGSSAPAATASPPPPAVASAAASWSWPEEELVGAATRRGKALLWQPRVVAQWHPNACGYHALFNVRLLLQAMDVVTSGDVLPEESLRRALEDEPAMWRSHCDDMLTLSGKATVPAPQLRSCTIDKSHMEYIIGQETSLSERLLIVETATGGMPEVAELRRRIAAAPGGVLGLVLGAVTHWVAAVVAQTPQGPRILLADSHNKPLLAGTSAAELAEEVVEAVFPRFTAKIIDEMPQYLQAPEQVLRELWTSGVPEWWKGQEKDQVWWRHRPCALRKQLQAMEIEAIYGFLASLEEALDVAGGGNET